MIFKAQILLIYNELYNLQDSIIGRKQMCARYIISSSKEHKTYIWKWFNQNGKLEIIPLFPKYNVVF